MTDRSFGPHAGGTNGEYEHIVRLIHAGDYASAWTRLLAAVATSDDAGLYWAADLVEDLFAAQGWDALGQVEAQARLNGRFRRVLVDVTPFTADEALDARIEALRAECVAELGLPE
jgi:hypothetical protein